MYTEAQLFSKLEKADAAKDTEAAKAIANEIRRVRASAQTADTLPESAQPDLSAMSARIESEKQGPMQRLGRQAGITARDMTQGLLSLPAMAGDLAAYPINAVSRLSGGQDVFPPQSQALDSALTQAGLPSAETPGEQLQSSVTRSVAGAAGGIGLGMQLAKSASAVTAGVGNTLRAAPASQLVAGGAAGGSSEFARQQGVGAAGQMAAGLVGGVGAGMAAQRVSRAMQPAVTRAETVKEATLREAQQEGYVVSPAATTGRASGKVLAGLSGKAKTEQLARIKNQTTTDNLARRAIGLADDAQLTPENIQNVRAQAYQDGYVPLTQAGAMQPGAEYRNALNVIRRNYAGQASSFPQAVRQDVIEMIDSINVNQFDSGDAVNQIRLLREQAKGAFSGAQPDQILGRAYREASNALEDELQRNIQNSGNPAAPQILEGFRNARRLIARSHTVEDALIEGGGNVDAAKIAREFQKGAPLDGELRTIGAFANNYKESARLPSSADANALTVLDFTTMGAGAGVAGMSSGAGIPLMMLPPARVAARYGALSQPGQRMFTRPNLNVRQDGNLNSLLYPVLSSQ